jgi:hypothetical protein
MIIIKMLLLYQFEQHGSTHIIPQKENYRSAPTDPTKPITCISSSSLSPFFAPAVAVSFCGGGLLAIKCCCTVESNLGATMVFSARAGCCRCCSSTVSSSGPCRWWCWWRESKKHHFRRQDLRLSSSQHMQGCLTLDSFDTFGPVFAPIPRYIPNTRVDRVPC